ncbi:MAG TPA: hypothetical protein VKY27_05985 [Bacteriovoracaceae bacterium]|nr:hypothetical protein [Bacteriovoracaceae bacterium]
MSACYKCGTELPKSFSVFISRSDTCTQCRTDIRCCRMCQFYDPQSYNECRESSADRITDKEKANFCDYFKLSSSYNDPNKEREDQLARAAALFKK